MGFQPLLLDDRHQFREAIHLRFDSNCPARFCGNEGNPAQEVPRLDGCDFLQHDCDLRPVCEALNDVSLAEQGPLGCGNILEAQVLRLPGGNPLPGPGYKLCREFAVPGEGKTWNSPGG